MKKMLFGALIVLFAVVSCKENPSSKVNKENLDAAKLRDKNLKGAPVVSFDQNIFDFGVVQEGDTVRTTFKVTNKGETDLIISNAKAGCGCTIPTWPKEAIKPGASADVGVVFNTAGKKNKQTKTVTLTTNTENGSETVSVSGMVTPKKEE